MTFYEEKFLSNSGWTQKIQAGVRKIKRIKKREENKNERGER